MATRKVPGTIPDFVFWWNELLDSCDEQIESAAVPRIRASTETATIVSRLAGQLRCQQSPRPRVLARVILWQFLAALRPPRADDSRLPFLESVIDDDLLRRDETGRQKKAARTLRRLLSDLERVDRLAEELPWLDHRFDVLRAAIGKVREQAEAALEGALSPGRPRELTSSGFARRTAITLAALPLDHATVAKLIADVGAWTPPPLRSLERIALLKGTSLRKRLDRLRAAIEKEG